jgi:hypothetical protein
MVPTVRALKMPCSVQVWVLGGRDGRDRSVGISRRDDLCPGHTSDARRRDERRLGVVLGGAAGADLVVLEVAIGRQVGHEIADLEVPEGRRDLALALEAQVLQPAKLPGERVELFGMKVLGVQPGLDADMEIMTQDEPVPQMRYARMDPIPQMGEQPLLKRRSRRRSRHQLLAARPGIVPVQIIPDPVLGVGPPDGISLGRHDLAGSRVDDRREPSVWGRLGMRV